MAEENQLVKEKIEVTDEMREAVYGVLTDYDIETQSIWRGDLIIDKLINAVLCDEKLQCLRKF